MKWLIKLIRKIIHEELRDYQKKPHTRCEVCMFNCEDMNFDDWEPGKYCTQGIRDNGPFGCHHGSEHFIQK